ncbi:MAG: hypothetical protein U0414_03015 [Polyangiaceae bacterium]
MALSAALVITVASTARADDSAEAGKLYDEADAAAAKSDWITCVAKTEAAWAKFQHVQIRGLQGKCEVELKRFREGATHISFYATNATTPIEADIQAALERAKQHVDERLLKASETGAEIRVDGVVVGNSPLTVFLDPGRHKIEATAGTKKGAIEIDAAAGSKPPGATEIPMADGSTGGTPGAERRPLWPGILGVSLAAAALGVGVGMTVAANAEPSWTCTTPACPEGEAFVQDKYVFSNTAVWMYISAGTFAVAGTALLVWATTGPKAMPAHTTGTTVAPFASSDGAGAMVFGTF